MRSPCSEFLIERTRKTLNKDHSDAENNITL